jgi:integrase
VFPNAIGGPVDPSNLRRTVKAVCDKAEVEPISPNEMRHSAATLMMEAGVPMQEAADVLGHNDMRMMARVYRHKRGVVDATEGQERMLG